MTDLRYVVYFVGAVLLVSVLGIIYLAAAPDRAIPDVLQNIAVGSLTGLVGLLAPSPLRNRGQGGAIDPAVALIVTGVGFIFADAILARVYWLGAAGAVLAVIGGLIWLGRALR